MTSTKIGELSVNPSEKGKCHIVLSDKQAGYLKDIYHRMPIEAEQLIAQGFHNDAFDVVLRERRFTLSMDFWIREVVRKRKEVQKKLNSSSEKGSGRRIFKIQQNEV